MRDSQLELLKCHRHLDRAIRRQNTKAFVSGWSIENPLAAKYLQAEDISAMAARSAHRYQFLSDNLEVSTAITKFHSKSDGVLYDKEEIFAAAGSSPLLLAVMALLRDRSVGTIYYIPPVYYAFYYWARMFNIKMVPVTDAPIIDGPSELSLPSERSVLLLSDPIWAVGRPLSLRTIERIASWQSQTSSLVIVDGTFQYMKWDMSETVEFSSLLVKSQTLRIVCPTKALGVHAVRFAYLLLPEAYREDVRYPASNSSGASDGFNVAGALQILKCLNGPERNRKFIEHIQGRYRKLRGSLFERLMVEPTATYYAFGDLIAPKKCLAMDGRFFEMANSNGARINLLVPEHELSKLEIKIAA